MRASAGASTLTAATTGVVDDEAGLYFPANHPAIEAGRPVAGGLHVRVDHKTIDMAPGAFLEGPARLGDGWVLRRDWH